MANRSSKLNFKLRLVFTFLVVGLAPLSIASLVNYYQASNEISKLASEKVELVAGSKAQLILNYFEGELASLSDLAENPFSLAGTQELTEAFQGSLEVNDETLERYRKSVRDFYDKEFAAKYETMTSKKFSTDSFITKLDRKSIVAQHDFISSNPHPLGEKDQLSSPLRISNYGQVHSQYHPHFRDYLKRHSLYDLFIVDNQGRVVYSVFKETDFGTDLLNGPWASSGLGRAAQRGLALSSSQLHIEDFDAYTPSYEAPASFASVPLIQNGETIGTMIIQFPLDKISAVVGAREGLGERGETLLLGSDLRLRADTFRNKETHTVAENFKPDSKIAVTSPAVLMAKEGKVGVMNNTSYDGLSTLAFFRPLKIKDLTWYMVVELDEAEVNAGLTHMSYFNWFIQFLGSFAIILVSMIYGSRVTAKLREIGSLLNVSNDKISGASHQSAASAIELREAATEQAASLQETMASTEEISAMVNQNAESANKVKTTVDVNQKEAEEGSRRVNEVLDSISEIKRTNEEILDQMETSNKEFGNIVKIIAEIGEKTNVINEIVFQTKLLSFNASVEAARAGEHGKGFAVVAEEVGNLAQMSGNAAKQITEMLTNSIKEVNDIVEKTTEKVDKLVEVGKDKISMGLSTAQKCREVLDKITENARSISSMIAEITHASKEQAQGIQEINKAISQLDQVTQQNSSVAQQSSHQAEGLKLEAEHLTEAVATLMVFVEGRRASTPPDAQTAPSSVQRHAKDSSSAAVLPFTSRPTSSANSANMPLRQASGFSSSGQPPKSDDPGFEEF